MNIGIKAVHHDERVERPEESDLAMTRAALTAMEAFQNHPEFSEDMRIVMLVEAPMENGEGTMRATIPGGFVEGDRNDLMEVVCVMLGHADLTLQRLGLPGLELEIRGGNPRRVGGRRPRPRSRK
jgi:hypothetical protein